MRDVIIPLDFATGEEALAFLSPFEKKLFVNIDMELICAERPDIVKKIRAMGH